MAKLIDFEELFHSYLHEYQDKHEMNEDVLEEIAPELYLRWLDLPLGELDGQTPNGYFDHVSGSDLLVLLGQYFFSELQIPGALMARIAETSEETFPYVHSMLQNYEGERGDEFRAVLVQLIEEMEMPHPYAYYIEVLAGAAEGNDFTEACVDALKGSGDKVQAALIAAYEAAQSEYAAECFLDVLSDLAYDERVYGFVLDKFIYGSDKRAFYASCLGKLGNEKAVPYLEEAIRQDGLTYFEYISMRNALEELGGDVDIERDFTGDRDYDMLSGRGE
jgi:hypothetical protein